MGACSECIKLVDYCSDLVAVQMAVDALAPVSAHTGGITSLGDERGLHRVKKTPIVVLDLAQLQEVLAYWKRTNSAVNL